jgi:hypothetical protein
MTTTRKDVLAEYRRTLDSIRGDRKMTDAARQLAAARAYTTARTGMTRATRDHQAAQSTRWDQLERKLWGLPQPSIYATATEQAAQAMAMRDALERVTGLKTEGDALRLLRQAEQTGDETLARAVAQHANERDWTDTLLAFFGPRPGTRDAYDEMCAIHSERTSGQVVDQLAHHIAKPEELRGMDDRAIEQLADDAGQLAAG